MRRESTMFIVNMQLVSGLNLPGELYYDYEPFLSNQEQICSTVVRFSKNQLEFNGFFLYFM